VASTFWLEIYSPEIAKPAGKAGRPDRQRPGETQCLENLLSPTFPSFARRFFAMGGLVPLSGRFWRVAMQPDGDFDQFDRNPTGSF
jgi:hypothetical protein